MALRRDIEECQNMPVRVADVKLATVGHHTQRLDDLQRLRAHLLLQTIEILLSKDQIHAIILPSALSFAAGWSARLEVDRVRPDAEARVKAPCSKLSSNPNGPV